MPVNESNDENRKNRKNETDGYRKARLASERMRTKSSWKDLTEEQREEVRKKEQEEEQNIVWEVLRTSSDYSLTVVFVLAAIIAWQLKHYVMIP